MGIVEKCVGKRINDVIINHKQNFTEFRFTDNSLIHVSPTKLNRLTNISGCFSELHLQTIKDIRFSLEKVEPYRKQNKTENIIYCTILTISVTGGKEFKIIWESELESPIECRFLYLESHKWVGESLFSR